MYQVEIKMSCEAVAGLADELRQVSDVVTNNGDSTEAARLVRKAYEMMRQAQEILARAEVLEAKGH